MPLGASRRGAVIFCNTKHTRIGLVSVLGPQNAPKSLAAGASPQTSLGELTAPSDFLAGFKGAYF